MKTRYIVALSIAAGVGIGAAAVQTIHAQAKPPGYIVAEIDVGNVEGYTKEYLPLAIKSLQDFGVKFLARGGNSESIDGTPPSKRVIVSQFESLEKAVAAYKSPAYSEARKIGNKYAKFRIWAVEGLAK